MNKSDISRGREVKESKMAVHYRTQGFVLKKTDLREADQVFCIFTKDFGKIEILGKAIRKIKSKLRPGADLFYLSDIEFIQGKAYKTLTDAILIEKFKNIRQDLEKLKIAYKITELADELIRGEEQDQEIWNLLNEVFEKLNNWSLVTGHWSFYYYFLWNLLSILGYQIDLYNCSKCQEKLKAGKLYFSPAESGIFCQNCSKKGEKISPEIIKILRLFLKKDWPILSRLKITDFHRKELELISQSAIIYLR